MQYLSFCQLDNPMPEVSLTIISEEYMWSYNILEKLKKKKENWGLEQVQKNRAQVIFLTSLI